MTQIQTQKVLNVYREDWQAEVHRVTEAKTTKVNKQQQHNKHTKVTPRHIIFKVMKAKGKEDTLKTDRGKRDT